MNLLDRANSFLRGSGKKLALTVVPLAILAAPAAKATQALPSVFQIRHSGVEVYNAVYSGGDLFSEGMGTSVGGFYNGIRLYTSASGIEGVISCGEAETCDEAELDFSWGGPFMAGHVPDAGQAILVRWDFSSDLAYDWEVDYAVRTEWASYSGSAAAGATASGSGVAYAGGIGDVWLATIEIYWTGVPNGSTFQVIVPERDSDDLNLAPEPATLLLLGPALGLLLLKRRRARR